MTTIFLQYINRPIIFADLHPLALEDIFHVRSQNRSKADYYSRHLFLRVLCHELAKKQPGSSDLPHLTPVLSGAYRSASPDLITEESPEKTGDAHVDEDGILNRLAYGKRRRSLPLHAKTTGDLEAVLGNKQTSYSSLAKLLKPRSLVVGSFDASIEQALIFF